MFDSFPTAASSQSTKSHPFRKQITYHNEMNSSTSSYAFKSESSPNTVIKNTPLAPSEVSYPMLFHYESSKKKSTKGDTATLTEVLLTCFMPALNKFITIIWSIWNNQGLFLTMLDQVKRDSTEEKPLLLYSESGAGKNNLYELIFQHSNKYSVYGLPENDDIQMTAQVILLFNSHQVN